MKKRVFSVEAFVASECGAVTVDWVVLSGALVGLGLATTAVVSNGMADGASGISTQMAGYEIRSAFAEVEAETEAEAEAEAEGEPFARNQWTSRTGNVQVLEDWMAGFTDENLLAHMNNQAQYADGSQTGHPYDTYHDEYWVARDEAITRGLIEA
ncbi:MAG: hypothetical protein ACMUJJ_09750 [Roseicyclus sp.]|uniref:hypothetical protein n=1 Tax=Roseicyclus sp. TaxID=1914329 RepID=UPI003A868A59